MDEEDDGEADGHAGEARRWLCPCVNGAGPWQRLDVVENEGESEVDLRGEAQGPRGEWGRLGGETEGARRRRPYPLVVAGERVRRGRTPVPTRVRGTGKGGDRGRRAGSAGWARWAS